MDDCHGTFSVSTFKNLYESCEGILKYIRRRSNIYCWMLWSMFPLCLVYIIILYADIVATKLVLDALIYCSFSSHYCYSVSSV